MVAATAAEAGMVNTQAQTIRVATPQRTAERRSVLPTPTMAPVRVWVVETGMPAEVAGIEAPATMPMVFCASLPPWPSEYAAAERSWSLRNQSGAVIKRLNR